MERINWREDIRDGILKALQQNPPERFPNARSIWYYLWSALHIIPGTESTYKKVDALLVKLRKEGLIPFGRLQVERGKDGYGGMLSVEPASLIEQTIHDLLTLPQTFKLPQQFGQPNTIEVWVEKKGLLPTCEVICDEYDIKVRSPEGFSPWEFIYHVTQDWKSYFNERSSHQVKILYFGDQDPSGENIYESVKEQLDFFKIDHDTQRIGLTVPQINRYGLPQMPLDQKTLEKIRRDPRYQKYVRKYGREIFCELDSFISLAYDDFNLTVQDAIDPLVDQTALRETKELTQQIRDALGESITPDKDLIEEIKKRVIDRYQDSKPDGV